MTDLAQAEEAEEHAAQHLSEAEQQVTASTVRAALYADVCEVCLPLVRCGECDVAGGETTEAGTRTVRVV